MKRLLEKINNNDLNKKKKLIAEIVFVLVLMTLFIGVSIAGGYWSYKSSSANTLETGSVSLTFLESNSVIDITNALPKSDNDGKTQNDLFEFAVTSNSDPIQTISYDINIEPIVVETGYTGLTPEDIKVYLTDKEGNVLVEPTKLSNLNDFKLYSNKHKHVTESSSITSKYVLRAWIDRGVSATDWYKEYQDDNIQYQYKFRINVSGKSTALSLDTSGANPPELSENMIAVYYDEVAETWKKADANNSKEQYKWYDYDSKMWANSVTVSSTNRSTYLSADPGTEIPMDDILTMQVWIPRYKYKIFNYNENGTTYVDPQEIEITFESGTASTEEVTCTDSISGTDGAASETCKLKSTSATCTDSTCNGKTYTHPAFTFGDEELTGIWVGKFETTGTTSNITIKPDLISLGSQNVSTFETNIMAMNDSGNQYGFTTSDDTHMMKNMEWGAVAYLSHSKYGTCTGGTCREIYVNNSSNYYTGRSSGTSDGTVASSISAIPSEDNSGINIDKLDNNESSKNVNMLVEEMIINNSSSKPLNLASNDSDYEVRPLIPETTDGSAYGIYTYDGYLLESGTNTKSSTKDMTKVASTTGNIYGIYDMSGGSEEYVMGNLVSSDGQTMMTGNSTSFNSGYTGIIYGSGNYTSYTGTYSYPENKYLDKYSFGTDTQRIRTKLGDAVKEVGSSSSYNWYSDFGYVASSLNPWFMRGAHYYGGTYAGVFSSNDNGGAYSGSSARVVIAP